MLNLQFIFCCFNVVCALENVDAVRKIIHICDNISIDTITSDDFTYNYETLKNPTKLKKKVLKKRLNNFNVNSNWGNQPGTCYASFIHLHTHTILLEHCSDLYFSSASKIKRQ